MTSNDYRYNKYMTKTILRFPCPELFKQRGDLFKVPLRHVAEKTALELREGLVQPGQEA